MTEWLLTGYLTGVLISYCVDLAFMRAGYPDRRPDHGMMLFTGFLWPALVLLLLVLWIRWKIKGGLE